jgi:hydrogenase expression/formation protein HypE
MSPVKKGYTRPLDLKHGRVDMSHGGGGRAMVQLITDLFAKHLGNEYLAQGNDGTWLPAGNGRLVVSTDSHVVSPLFFPGGDIGGLSVHGTVNDVAVMGATPLYLTAGFILEEGFPLHVRGAFPPTGKAENTPLEPDPGHSGVGKRQVHACAPCVFSCWSRT